MNSYSEYFIERKPTSFGEHVIKWWHKRMLKIAGKLIPELPAKTLLELGPGHGFIADICKSTGLSYCGHEMNVAQANFLKAQGHDVTPATIPPIPPGKPVQVMWLSHILEHAISYREAREMLLACYDRLDPAGYVVIIAPDIHHWKTDFWSLDWSHGFPTSLNRVQQLLHDTGFTVHHAFHHTFTLTNPFAACLISWCGRLFLPISMIDMISQKTLGRRFGSAFMSLCGLRQIYLIGKK